MSTDVGTARDPLVTGAEYVRHITSRKSDRRARTAFQQLALSLVAPGATLFDFGCGTGLDARVYAERGCTVRAYDVDGQMAEYFSRHCRDLIEAGRVRPESGRYQDFLVRDDDVHVDLVTANFAPLNLVADLKALFAKFHALTAPDGQVLASVLNPYFVGDLQYAWWWRNLPRLWRNGRYSVAGAQAAIFRRRPADLAAESAPYFLLTHLFRGLPSGATLPTAVSYCAARPMDPLRLTTSRFMFVLFRRCALAGAGSCDSRAPPSNSQSDPASRTA